MPRLGDIATVITKGTTPTSIGFNFQNEGINFVKIESVDENGNFIYEKFDHISDECHEKLKRSQLKENDVLFSIAGAIGRTAIVTKDILPANANQALAIIRIPQGAINYSFLLYIFQSSVVLEQAEKKKQGVAQLNLSLKDISDFIIPDIPLEKQQEIVDNLDKVSNLISLRKQQLSKLDELVKARFVEMFGDFETNSYGWELTTLGACCELNPRRPKDINTDVNYSFVAMSSVSEDGRIDTSVVRPYAEVCKGFTYFAENDVLFAKITPCMENGKGGVAIGLKNGAGFGSTEFHVLRPIRGISDPYWLYTITMLKRFRSDAEKVMTGTGGQRRVPIAYLNEYKIALPPIDLQEQFSIFVKQTDKSKLEIQQSLEKLETLKKALMQKYFG